MKKFKRRVVRRASKHDAGLGFSLLKQYIQVYLCVMELSGNPDLEACVRALPELPGVYIMHGREGEILYVGKAKRLRHRVASYFNKTQDSAKTRALVQQIASIRHIVAGSESEAFLIEANLIKEHHPRYNIQLRDSKRYPWLAVSVGEDFPRFFKTRQNANSENRYFGPYPSVAVIRNTISLLHRLFRFRYCHKKLCEGVPAPPMCFYFHIKRCPGPCTAQISRSAYRESVERALLFLEGKQEELRGELDSEMRRRAKALDYEGAALLRDQLAALIEAGQEQAVCRLTGEGIPADIDLAALAEGAGIAACALFVIREGKLVAQHLYLEENADGKPELLTQFLRQHYSSEQNARSAKHTPAYLLLDQAQASAEETEADDGCFMGMRLLDSKAADAALRRLMRQAETNAGLALEEELKRRLFTDGLVSLQKLLGLPKPPSCIEAFDIANTGGEANVAACVHFKNGRPDKKSYRKFIIRSVEGQDDFASMREAVGRRYQRLANENKPLPDLVLIDGGREQLRFACAALAALDLASLPVLALAKKEELIYLPDREDALRLDHHHFALRLLQTIRNEAHRYVNTFHKQKRDDARARSVLEDIAGIGPASRRKLLIHFGSLEGARAASEEELAQILGSAARARSLKRALENEAAE